MEKLLINNTMDPDLVDHLCRLLTEAIDGVISAEIERDDWGIESWPYFGNSTFRLMAEAGVGVLNGIYEAERVLVQEGWLDARGAILPED